MKIGEFNAVKQLIDRLKLAKDAKAKLDLPDTKIELRIVPVHGDPSFIRPAEDMRSKVYEDAVATIREIEGELQKLGVELDATS